MFCERTANLPVTFISSNYSANPSEIGLPLRLTVNLKGISDGLALSLTDKPERSDVVDI